MTERIISAAIMVGGRTLICSLPPPARHHDIMEAAFKLGDGYCEYFGDDEQGFLTNAGRFVGRHEAHAIATAAGQIIRRCGGDERTLYSENLW